MVHFDFTVTDYEAERIMEIMRSQIVSNLESIIELMVKPDVNEDFINGYRQDNEYIEELISKMLNTRVEHVCNS
jgi:transcription termination factor NusB